MDAKQIAKFCDKNETINMVKTKNELEIIAYFSENGLQITMEQAKKMKDLYKNIDLNGKYIDEDLEAVSGGTSAGKIAAGIILGIGGVATLGLGGKFLYDVYNTCSDNSIGSKFSNGLKDMGLKDESPYQKAVRDTATYLKQHFSN